MDKRLHCAKLAALLLGAVAGGAGAQPVVIPPGADPAVIQQREIEREQRRRAEEQRQDRIERPLAPVAPPAAPAPSATDNVQFAAREIRFEPASQLLAAAELQALAAPYTGRTLRLSELRELVAKVNALYRAKGVVTAQASLPPQDVTEGVVRILLTEGRVGRIAIQGNASTREDYITERLSLQPQMLVQLPQLEQDLLRFNRSNDAQLKADLVPGQALGQTDLALTLSEPKRDELRLFVDNTGSSATGERRTGVAYLRRSLTGRRDDLSLSTVRAAGHEGHYVSYGLPVSSQGTRLTLGYFKDRTRIVNGPVEPLDVTGSAESYSVQLRHPLHVGTALQVDALASLKKRRSSNFIVGTPLTSAENTGGSAGVDLQLLDERGYWAASAELHAGVERIAGVSPRHYDLVRAAVRRSYSLTPQWTLNGSLNLQLTTREQLPSGEQLVIGGEGTVRGYASGLFSGDRGHILNLEAHRRVELPQPTPWAYSVFGFTDYGYVRPYRPPGNTRGADVLQSVGAGMHFAYGSRVTLRFALALPVNRPAEEPRDYRVHSQLVIFLL
jgi:hemolysin activation/secretion protein